MIGAQCDRRLANSGWQVLYHGLVFEPDFGICDCLWFLSISRVFHFRVLLGFMGVNLVSKWERQLWIG